MFQACVPGLSLLQHMMLIVKTLVAMKVKQAMELKLAVQFVLMQNAIAFSSHVAIASLVISAEQNKLLSIETSLIKYNRLVEYSYLALRY